MQITGHNLTQPKAIDAPLEFSLDASMVAKCKVELAKRRAVLDGMPEQIAAMVDAKDELPGVRWVPEDAA